MSAKHEIDKAKPGFPWTARQRRMKASNRLHRKQTRKVLRWRTQVRSVVQQPGA